MGYRLTPGSKFDDILTTALDYDTSDNLIYQGQANPGASKSASVWRIKKFTYSTGNLTDIQFADGNDRFDNIWDDRVSLNYS